MRSSSFLRSTWVGFGLALVTSAANAQSVTISAPFDVTNEVGTLVANAVGDFTPVVIPGPGGAAFLGFIRVEGATHVTGTHSIIVRSVTSTSATTGTTALGRTTDVNLPFATSLALSSEGSVPVAIYGLTDSTVQVRPVMGGASAAFTLVPLMGAMVQSGDTVADVSAPVLLSEFDVGITARITGTPSSGHLCSVAIAGAPGSLRLVGQEPQVVTNQLRAVIRAAGPGGGFASLFLDYNPGSSVTLRVHQADGRSLAMASTISTARPGFTSLGSGDYLVVLNPESGSPPSPTQLQCKILTTSTTPALDGSGAPCPVTPSPPTDIAAATDPSDPNSAWIGGTFADGNPTVFIALNGSSDAPAIGVAGSPFSGCAHPSVAAIDSTHAVISALCGINTMAPHVLIWIATKPPVPVDAGVPDAGSDAMDVASSSPDTQTVDASSADVDDVSDAAPAANINQVSFRGSGCNCRTVPASRRGGLAAFGVLALVAVRRRRVTAPSKRR